MNGKLFMQAIIKFTSGLILTIALLFIPAGTIYYVKGWIFIAILFIPMFIAGIILMMKNPALLEKRLNAKEKQSDQKFFVLVMSMMFVSGFVCAGFNYRFSWVVLPMWVTIVSSVIFILGYIMYGEVLRENEYLSRTVEVQKNQKVIDTGLYSVIRHPMYSATLILFLSMPFVLGSPITFFILLVYPIAIISRLLSEEEYLEKNLDGYKEYEKKVKYRLIPYIF